MDARTTAMLIAGGRVAFGIALLARPAAIGRTWIGPDAESPGGRAAVRAVGVRDLILGLGALVAAGRAAPVRGWVEAGAAADIGDVLITLSDFGDMPPLGRWVTLVMAGGSALASLRIAGAVDAVSEAA